MPIDASVDSLDKVPESLRSEYEPRDGKFVLRLNGELPGYVPKAKLDEFRSNNIELDKRAKALEAQVEKYKDIDPDKAREALSKLTKLDEKKLIDEGKIDELVNQRVERFASEKQARIDELAKEVEKHRTRADGSESELSRVLIQGTIDETALRHKVLPSSLNIVRLLAQHGDHNGVRWSLDPDSRKPLAVKHDGQPAWSGKDATKPLDMNEWLEQVVKVNPQIVPNSSGGGAIGSTAGGGQRTDLSALPPTERLKAFRRSAA